MNISIMIMKIEFINLWNEYIKAEKTTIMKLFL